MGCMLFFAHCSERLVLTSSVFSPRQQSWLTHRRNAPPSDSDIQDYDKRLAQLQQRARELDTEDAKLRMQEQTRAWEQKEGSDDVVDDELYALPEPTSDDEHRK